LPVQSLFDFLLPPASLLGQAGTWLTPEEPARLRAEKNVRRLEQAELSARGMGDIDRLVAFTSYAGSPLLRLALHRWKYGGVQLYGPVLAALLMTVSHHLQVPPIDAVSAVPLHWRRRFWRGFNQSEVLARVIARELHAPYQPLLHRHRAGRPQVGRTEKERQTALLDAFISETAAGHVLLVDDVVTTGGTVRGCAAALRQAGAQRVSVVCLAFAG
jgi:ComF family protein